jgi:hypothetical protein
VSGRAVGPRWHDAVAYAIDNDNVLINSKRGWPESPPQTIATGMRDGSDWLPLGEAAVRIGMKAMCPAVSGEKFSPTENARVSMFNTPQQETKYCPSDSSNWRSTRPRKVRHLDPLFHFHCCIVGRRSISNCRRLWSEGSCRLGLFGWWSGR